MWKSTIKKAVRGLLFSALLFQMYSAHAQNVLGTGDDGFVIQITSPSSIAQTIEYGFDPGVCQWIGQSEWGADITQAFCGEVVWADDSLGCVPLTNGADLSGKIALIRRGGCSFSLKTYHAQLAGAIAVVIINHYDNPQDGPCDTYVNATQFLGGMSGLDSAALVNIPAVFLERMTGEDISGALDAGEAVNICFTFPRMTSPTAASMYATPITQVDTMQAITVLYNNRSGADQSDVNLKAEIFDPSGSLIGTLNYNMPSVSPNVDSFIVFPSFYAPPALGKHTVLFTNDKYTEDIDSVYAYFEHTPYTFATDNLVLDPGGVGPSDEQFATASFYIQSGGICFMGDAPGVATYATFGIANAADVFIPGGGTANQIGIALYRADVDGDGAGDITADFVNDLGAGLVGFAEYEMTGDEEDGELIHVPLIDLISGGADGVPLDANEAYYISLFYDGTEAGLGTCVRFANSTDVGYASFNTYPTSPLYLGQLFGGGWQGAMVVQRLQLEGFDPTIKTQEPTLLSSDKVKITPNPANEFVQVNLDLAGVNPSVAVSILDNRGRLVGNTQIQKNFQQGVLNFNVQQLPSGTYYVWVRSAEGSTLKPVAVCH